MLAAVRPLARPVWFEAALAGKHGTAMIMGYGAVPAADGIAIGWACYAPAHGRIIGPLGPATVNPAGMERPPGTSDESWRELHSAAGIVLRALLLGMGSRARIVESALRACRGGLRGPLTAPGWDSRPSSGTELATPPWEEGGEAGWTLAGDGHMVCARLKASAKPVRTWMSCGRPEGGTRHGGRSRQAGKRHR
jgi:hypothetical protein